MMSTGCLEELFRPWAEEYCVRVTLVVERFYNVFGIRGNTPYVIMHIVCARVTGTLKYSRGCRVKD